ncbi:MAG: hypothetical protein AUJ75_01595 [Candidatus Omnitrophica bacterium CG1_02_49_10]|nr:MAG: hypothetical protein AUJ75_01595 [Candidatus Omnitrophica bacterium CG1_02_49_10]
MSNILIKNGKVVTLDRIFRGWLFVRGKKIVRMGAGEGPKSLKGDTIDAKGRFISPGFIDLHIHGAPEEISRRFAKSGTTSFLASIEAMELGKVKKILSGDYSRLDGAKVLGFHLEGQYINPRMSKAQDGRFARRPDIAELKRLIEISKGRVKIVAVSPEIKGALELIKTLKDKVLFSLGHTSALFEEAEIAINSGARYAGHIFNAFEPFHHRNPGPIGAILTDDRVYAEIILDLIHTHAAAFELLLKCKPLDKIILVTDNTQESKFKRKKALKSSLTMERAVAHAHVFGGLKIEDAVKLATINPARAIGIDRKKGSLKVGKDADIVIFDSKFRTKATIVEGKIVCAE